MRIDQVDELENIPRRTFFNKCIVTSTGMVLFSVAQCDDKLRSLKENGLTPLNHELDIAKCVGLLPEPTAPRRKKTSRLPP